MRVRGCTKGAGAGNLCACICGYVDEIIAGTWSLLGEGVCGGVCMLGYNIVVIVQNNFTLSYMYGACLMVRIETPILHKYEYSATLIQVLLNVIDY